MAYPNWAKHAQGVAYLREAVCTIWYYEDDDGFQHRRNGRFHHRRDPRHIDHCVNMIKQRNARDEEVRVDD
jgi:hypothetical protein